jgi:hypothetical protein
MNIENSFDREAPGSLPQAAALVRERGEKSNPRTPFPAVGRGSRNIVAHAGIDGRGSCVTVRRLPGYQRYIVPRDARRHDFRYDDRQ